MKLEGIVKQLANRINQPHVVETYLKKVADTCYKKGLSDAKELEAQSNWIDVTPDIDFVIERLRQTAKADEKDYNIEIDVLTRVLRVLPTGKK